MSFESLKDLDILKTLSASEITEIMSAEDLKRQLIEQVGSIDNLVVLAQDLSAEKLASLFKVLDSALMDKMIKQPIDLAGLLFSLDIERIEAICSSLRLYLYPMFDKPQVLEVLRSSIMSEQYDAFIRGLSHHRLLY